MKNVILHAGMLFRRICMVYRCLVKGQWPLSKRSWSLEVQGYFVVCSNFFSQAIQIMGVQLDSRGRCLVKLVFEDSGRNNQVARILLEMIIQVLSTRGVKR